MAKNRIKLCWLLLLTLLFTANLLLSIGETQARYENSVTAGTLMKSSQYGLTSDCMVKRGDPSLTVLVGELSMEKSTEVSFWLKSHGADAAGKLAWSVSDPELAQYLRLGVKVGPLSVNPEEEIELMKDVPMAFTLVLTPTDIAQSTAHGMLKINVVVTWGDEMWGTFQVILPEVKEEQPPEETTAQEGNGDGTGQTVSPVYTNNLPFLADDAQEGTETEESDNTEEKPIRMETLSRFDPSEKLPLKAILTDNVTSIRLGMHVIEEEETRFEPFPDYTMFSLDNGESYYMMYDGYIAEFSLQDMTELPVLLDFRHADLETDAQLVLAMQAYAGDVLAETCEITTTADALASCQTLVHPVDQETQAVNFLAGDVQREAEEPQDYGFESRSLSKDNALEFTLPMEWLDAELEYSVDMLAMTEEQTLEYIPVELSRTGLYGTYMDYDLTHNLVLRIGEKLPQAGTYRLNMKWSYEGICYAQTQTTFFINYSAQTAYTLGS